MKKSISRRKLSLYKRSAVSSKKKYSLKPVKLTKKDLSKGTLLSKKTGTIEIQNKKPFYRRKGVLQIKFLFIKNQKQMKKATGRSNKLFLRTNYSIAYNQCFQRAMAQIDFSPVAVKVIDVKYIYWESIK